VSPWNPETNNVRRQELKKAFPLFHMIRERPSPYVIGRPPKTNGRTHPDRDEWLELPWPATRMTDEHRRMLIIMSNETNKPMTQILVESIELMYEMFRNGG